MERAYLEWNIPNWITVILMVSVGTLALGFVSSAVKSAVKS